MRIIVTGKEGQVARALTEGAPRHGHQIIALARPQLDLAGDASAIIASLVAARPDAIVSAAAYTAVDKAESEPDLAFAVNANGASAVALAAARLGVPVIHLSTDYVFDGTKVGPYCESDSTAPTSVYGASKLAGEVAVLAASDNAAILRTAWVYSPFGANFVQTMLRLADERDAVSVVADQVGCPTNALDLADAVLAVANQLVADPRPDLRGLFHVTGAGQSSWAEFAAAIFAASAAAGGAYAHVRPIATAEYPTAARRPANSRLDCSKLEAVYGVRLPTWTKSLTAVVERMVTIKNNEEIGS